MRPDLNTNVLLEIKLSNVLFQWPSLSGRQLGAILSRGDPLGRGGEAIQVQARPLLMKYNKGSN